MESESNLATATRWRSFRTDGPACAWLWSFLKMRVCTQPWQETLREMLSALVNSTWSHPELEPHRDPHHNQQCRESGEDYESLCGPWFTYSRHPVPDRSTACLCRSTSPRSLSRSPSRSPARRLDETDEAQLERLYKPVFVLKPSSCKCSEGQTARFNLKVVGRPMPDTYWFHNGEFF